MSRVSIIIPAYNAGGYLVEAVTSVLGQSFKDVEAIVVDDGSSDGSIEGVKNLPGVLLLRQANAGESVARNNGATRASGAYFVFLDADDLLKHDMVEQCLNEVKKRSGLVCACGKRTHFQEGKPGKETKQMPLCGDVFWEIARGNTVIPGQCLMPKELFEKVGGFNEKLHFGEDYDFFLRVAQLAPFAWIDEIVLNKREHKNMQTRSKEQPDILTNRIEMLSHITRQDEVHCKRLIGRHVLSDWIMSQADVKLKSGDRTGAAIDLLRSLVTMPRWSESLDLIKSLISGGGAFDE